MSAPSTASVADDNFRLFLGSELDVAAEEIAATGRAVRFGPGELLTAGRLPGGERGHALLVITEDLVPFPDAEVVTHPPELDDLAAAALLTEAVARAWFYRLTLTTVGPLALTLADAESIGRLGVPGQPLLSEYLAQRRWVVRGGLAGLRQSPLGPGDNDSACQMLLELAEESGSRVTFGAAGLAASATADLPAMIRLASGEGEWLESLRVALAAEQSLAADILIEVLLHERDDTPDLEEWSYLRSIAAARAGTCRLRVPLFHEVHVRLGRTPRRGRGRNRRRLGEQTSAYIHAFSDLTDLAPTPGAVAARELLGRLAVSAEYPGVGEEHLPSLADLAVRLGTWVGQRRRGVEERLGQLRKELPDEEDSVLFTRVRRHTLAALDALDPAEEEAAERLSDLLVDHVLAGQTLRGAAADDESVARLLLHAVTESADIRDLVVGGGGEAPRAQSLLLDFAFRQVGEAPGVAREIYGLAREKLGRRLSGPAHRGADRAQMVALDRTASRLLLWSLDGQLSTPHS